MASGFESTFERILRGPKQYKTSKGQRDYMCKYRRRRRAIKRKLKELQA